MNQTSCWNLFTACSSHSMPQPGLLGMLNLPSASLKGLADRSRNERSFAMKSARVLKKSTIVYCLRVVGTRGGDP
jgi:hypothetical protein